MTDPCEAHRRRAHDFILCPHAQTGTHDAECTRLATAFDVLEYRTITRCAEEADPGCDCGFPAFDGHGECKGARDAVRRIRALATKEEP